MKRSLLFLCTLVLSASALAVEVDPKVDKAILAALPVCDGSKVVYGELELALPERFKGYSVRVSADRRQCESQMSAVVTPQGGLFLGYPWPLAGAEGATPEEKLKNFVWKHMQMIVTASIDRSTTTLDGLHPATLLQTTDNGKMPMNGFIDPAGRFFFLGSFKRLGNDVTAQRVKAFEPFFAQSPSRGSASAPVTIVEFSDFECPSCKRASAFVDPILAKYGENVRYIRFDLPLAGHPWSFAASMAGRAIYKQKPELFWQYKKTVYDNQENLNAFSFGDWARTWAESQGLDMKRYDADVMAEDVKTQLLKGAGAAFSNDVMATPTYMINGTLVDYGDNGAGLMAFVDKLVKQPAKPNPEKPSASAQ